MPLVQPVSRSVAYQATYVAACYLNGDFPKHPRRTQAAQPRRGHFKQSQTKLNPQVDKLVFNNINPPTECSVL